MLCAEALACVGIVTGRMVWVWAAVAVLALYVGGGWYLTTRTAINRHYGRLERRAERANRRVYEQHGSAAAQADWAERIKAIRGNR